MPKKTKKEKLLALYHKKIRLLENNQVTASPVSTFIKTPTPLSVDPINKEIPLSKPVSISPEIKQQNQYFFSDLKKSLFLITLIIGLEVGLYLTKLVK